MGLANGEFFDLQGTHGLACIVADTQEYKRRANLTDVSNREFRGGKREIIHSHHKAAASEIIDSFKDLSRTFSSALHIVSLIKLLASIKSEPQTL